MKDKSTKQLQLELDEIVDWFSSNDSNIDEAVDMYEKAIKIVNEIKKRLVSAENKIIKIKESFEASS